MVWRALQRIANQTDLMMAISVIGLIGMMLVPLPPVLLDLLLTIDLALALCIMMVAMYITSPLEFSVFPSVLLMATLYRLALNISATRLILGQGHAGKVIEAFGNFVVGGDLVVGLILFLILVTIQFIVITSGSQRVAEVAARFTLDEMPGKQMAIDADLNVGIITETEAKQRRRRIEQEADFYGAMDGATKFVRGDAIAGLIIVAINLLGGMIIGVLRLGMPLGEAVQRYCLLTVGDGLVTQLPALLISTATGLIVTRAASDNNLGREVTSQILTQPRAVLIAAGMLLVLGMVPGLPKFTFFLVGGLAGTIGYVLLRKPAAPPEATQPAEATPQVENLEELLHTDRLRIELGYELLCLTDTASGGDLPSRVKGVRRRAAERWGLLLPPVRIRDELSLSPNQYEIKLKGIAVSRGEIQPRRLMAMKNHPEAPPLEGRPGTDPVFGMDVWWVESGLQAIAEARGYTVVEPSTVIATHLGEIINERAAELLSRQDVYDLVEKVREREPAVVKDLIPEVASIGEIQQVLRNLLAEKVPIRDLSTILEALGDGLRVTQKLEEATELVRMALAPAICERYTDEANTLHVITLGPAVEEQLLHSLMEGQAGAICAPPPQMLRELLRQVEQDMQQITAQGREPVVLASPPVRRHLRALVSPQFPSLAVLSHAELMPGTKVRSEFVVTMPVAEAVA
jgi:flagellar biosynthesis protein FlhA